MFTPPVAEQIKAAARRAAQWQRDADLARVEGDSPDHQSARLRVARTFLAIHCPGRPEASATDEQAAAFLHGWDWSRPVQVIDLATFAEPAPPKQGVLARFRRRTVPRPIYQRSDCFTSTEPGRPQYALRGFASDADPAI